MNVDLEPHEINMIVNALRAVERRAEAAGGPTNQGQRESEVRFLSLLDKMAQLQVRAMDRPPPVG
jgi:hypothetical protein